MDPTKREDFEDIQRRFIQSVPVEQRLAGFTAEQRLAGLAPEQRLAGLAPEQWLAGVSEADQLLALSPHLLQLLPDDYIALLPADIQARVRARRGR